MNARRARPVKTDLGPGKVPAGPRHAIQFKQSAKLLIPHLAALVIDHDPDPPAGKGRVKILVLLHQRKIRKILGIHEHRRRLHVLPDGLHHPVRTGWRNRSLRHRRHSP